jgi:hypothetical protein
MTNDELKSMCFQINDVPGACPPASPEQERAFRDAMQNHSDAPERMRAAAQNTDLRAHLRAQQVDEEEESNHQWTQINTNED